MKQLFYISLFSILTAVHGLLFAHNISPSYDKFSVNRGIWKEIHIVYNQDFPYKQNYNKQNIKGCTKTYITSICSYKKDAKKTVPVLRCVEHIKLLRPDKIVSQWVKIQNKKHFFLLTLNTFNSVNIHAQITAIRPVKSDNHQGFLYSKQTGKVTGQFERHTVNVKKYTFRNMKTGKTTTVNATPEHPVYVKNRAAFIPMDLLRATDQLLNSAGQEIRLICPGNRIQRCGELLDNNIPLPVYNLEVDHHHTYFVSSISLLVHNVCELTMKLSEKIPELIRYQMMRHQREGVLSLKSDDDVQRAFTVLRELGGENIESDSHVILAASLHHRQTIRIDMLEFFLRRRKSANSREYYNLFSNLIHSISFQAQSFTSAEIESDSVFSTLLIEASRKPIVVMTNRNYSLISPGPDGCPILEILHKSEQIGHHRLSMSIDEVSKFASECGYGQPIKYWILMVSPNFTG